MRSHFTATGLLLLLNVPTFTNGLPNPLLEAPGAGASASALTSPPPSLTVPGARTPASQEVPIPRKDNGEDSLESRLELELAELQALRAQLASLTKEVDTRAVRLAARVGPTDRSALVDCDGPTCVFRAVMRKAGYAVEALRRNGGDGDGGDDDEYLPGQQRRHRRQEDAADSYPDLEPRDEVVKGLDLLIHKLLFSILAVFTIRHIAIGAGLMLLCFVVLWCGSLCRDALGKATGSWWQPWRAREGRIRLGDEEAVDWGSAEKGEERFDGKQGEPCEEEEGYWDEKAGFDEEGYQGEYVPFVAEDAEIFEDNDNEEGDEEQLTLGDEIASFRSAVELVENMVAAAEERQRGRTEYRAS
ncbi:uncharacterized protein B0H64DRAFT_225467 [Chaetomium fimeti]|uniref:Uncharacterized protein n=1 Tax=Chaetomium fimeti TaxID=1854472 RepID=A0AAE0H9E9_9PEZI|nr:hypothetical protein B0H64DRAFT_225467 [Chaetomium fimeti]